MTHGAAHIERFEYKYLITPEAATLLKGRLARSLHADTHNRGPAGYRVKSLYFDTWGGSDHLDKNAGLFHRKKYRLRVYDEADDAVRLERKEKQGDRQVKHSAWLAPPQAAALIAGARQPLLAGSDMRDTFYTDMALRRPVILIEYDRAAYAWPLHNTRITLDSHIRHSRTALQLFERHVPYTTSQAGAVVLEVKYDRVLEPFIRDLLVPFCASRLSFGKYERCMGLY